MKNFASYLFRISAYGALSALWSACAAAGTLAGKVTYDGSAVASAMVSVYQTETKRKSVTISNSQGAYRFDNLPNGAYIILVEKDGRRIYQGKVQVAEALVSLDVGLGQARAEPFRVAKGIELRGGNRVPLPGELQGKVWVYVSPTCEKPCMPQLLIFKEDRGIANYSEFTAMNLIRPALRKKGKLLFDSQVGPDDIEAMFIYDGRSYRLTGKMKGRVDRSNGFIRFDVYRQ